MLAQDAACAARHLVAVIICARRWDRGALVRDPPGREGGMRLAAAKDGSQQPARAGGCTSIAARISGSFAGRPGKKASNFPPRARGYTAPPAS